MYQCYRLECDNSQGWRNWLRTLLSFLWNIWRAFVLFMGPLIPLFCQLLDFCWCQSWVLMLLCCLCLLCTMDSSDSSPSAAPVHLLAGRYDKLIPFYHPQRSCEGYVFTPVCHPVHRGGSASVHAGTTPPEQTPPRTRHPRSRHPLGRRLLLRTVRILLECILVPHIFSSTSKEVEECSWLNPLLDLEFIFILIWKYWSPKLLWKIGHK